MYTQHLTIHRIPPSRHLDHLLDAHSVDAEAHWLPLVGPTAFVTARRLLHLTDGAGYQNVTVDVESLARSVGVSPKLLDSAIRRLDRFHLASLDEQGDLWITNRWPRSIAGLAKSRTFVESIRVVVPA